MFHIPIFTSQLEKSREAVDAANIRAAYAEAQTAKLTGASTTTATLNQDGSVSVANVNFEGTNNSDSYSSLAGNLPFTAPNEPSAGKHTLKFTWSADDKVTVTVADSQG